MKRYPAYKESGVEWIGEIPDHWEIGRIKYFNEIIMGQSPSSEDYTENPDSLPFLQGNAEFGDQNPTPSIYCNTANKKALKDDILISVRAPVGAINVSDREYGIGRGLAAIRSIERHRFNYYYLSKSKNYLDSLSTGSTFTAITVEDLKNLPYPKIPNTELSKIANFLDHKTRLIDVLVAKKRSLIELLKEERTSLINQAVTKGLDPKVQMKDSGIEWLGEIPEHWTLTSLKKITNKIGSGVTPTGGAEIYVESGIPFFRSQNIHYNGIKTEEIAFIPIDIHENMSASKVYSGDVLLNITGASIGRCCVYEGHLGVANVNQHVCILRPSNLVNPSFLYYFLYSEIGQVQIDLGITGSGREGLNFKNIGNFVFPLISADEQMQIVQYLNIMSKSIESVIIKADKEIELISEYKTSLINEVVTGKIQVSDAD